MCHMTVTRHCCDVLDFWDTAGQEQFNTMHHSYYHQAHACVLVSHWLDRQGAGLAEVNEMAL